MGKKGPIKTGSDVKHMPPNPKNPKGDKDGKHDGKDGKKHHKGKKHGGIHGGRYGAYGGYKGVKVSRARKLVNAELNPLIRALNHEIRQAKRENKRTVGDIKHVFNDSGHYIREQNKKVRGEFSDFDKNQQAATSALMQQLQAQGNQSAASSASELERLGLGNQFLGQLANDQAQAEMLARQQMANTRANAGLMGLGATEMGRSLVGMNHGSKSSQIGQAFNNRNNAISEIRSERRDLRHERPELLRQMLEQMAAQGWGQYVDTRNLNQQQQQINLQRRAQGFNERQANQANSQQNAYNSTLASLTQQQLANTYKRRP